VAVPECLACGACCFSTLLTYVSVSGADYSRFGDDAEEWVSFDGVRAYMRMVDGHCAALAVHGESGVLSCQAYEVRPQVCRDLARGGGACSAEIEAKRERPLLALGRARDRPRDDPPAPPR